MIYFNRGIITDNKEAFVVKVHSSDAAALADSASDYIEATFFSRTPEKQKRLTGEKSIIYNSGLVEITRAVSIQWSVTLRLGMVKDTDASVQEFLNRLLRRGVVNIRRNSSATWLKGYCTNIESIKLEPREMYKQDLEFVYGFIEEVV